MSRSQLLILAAALLLSTVAGCASDSPTQSRPSCETTGTCPPPPPPCAQRTPPSGYAGFCFGDSLRTYVVHLPDPMPAGRLPLMVSLHGAGGSAGADQPINFKVATDSGFVVVAPEGTMRISPLGGYGRVWNHGGSMDSRTGGVNDVGFISALIDTVSLHYSIDRARVFAVGFSNGSTMAYRLAHELSAKIAAIGAISGQEGNWAYAVPTDTVAIFHVHGLTDPLALYPGGGEQKSVPATIDNWRRINGCAAEPDTVLNLPNQGLLGLRWRSASGRGDVVLYTHPGGHGWPAPPASQIVGEAFLRFFKSLPPRGR